MTFERLFVIGPAVNRSENRSVQWECACNCGTITVVRSSFLLSGNTRSCGCLKREELSNRTRKADGEEGFNQLILKYKYGATKRGLEYSLSNKDAVKLFKSNCVYCGVAPKRGIGRTTRFIYNGIDRMDNTQGYTTCNAVACCTPCNFLKGSLSYQEFVDRVRSIYLHLFNGVVV